MRWRIKALGTLCVMLFAFLCVMPVSAKSAWYTVEGIVGGQIEFDPETGTITDCGYYVTTADIPKKIGGVEVTSIGERAFGGCSSLTSVTIPEGVTSIGYRAFSECSSLTSIVIPASVTEIEYWSNDGIFSGCSSLVSAGPIGSGCNIEYGWTETIPDYIFFKCSSLESVTIPEGVTSIGSRAFSECSSLTSVTIPEGVTSIGSSAFSECSSLKSVVIPEGVTSIGLCAFLGCSSLTSIVIPASVTEIEYWSEYGIFSGCSSLVSAGPIGSGCNIEYGWTETIPDYIFFKCSSLESVTIPEGVTIIGAYTFYNCSSLESVTIPEGVTRIGSGAFYGCSSLESVTIPEGVTIIGAYTFYNCSSLESVTIPEGVTSIGEYTFSGCSSLASVTIPEEVTSIGNKAFYGCSNLKSVGPIGSGCNIEYGWSERIPENVFKNCTEITSVEIPEGVASIGNNAFYGCSSLTSVKIPDGVTSIGNSIFSGCSSLESVTIPEGLTSIGRRAFYGCNSLKDVVIPTTIKSVYAETFYNCSSLESVTIPEGVTSIDTNAFYGCSNLKSAGPIGSGCNIEYGWSRTIPSIAFYNCSSLESVTIPDGVTSIGNSAFSGCNSLESVAIPEGVTSIGSSAFYGCSSLKNVVLPTTIKSVYEKTFYDCSSLESMTIPEGVTSIGNSAFYGCSSLENVTISSDVKSIGEEVFRGCSSLTGIIIPEGVTAIKNFTFYGCSSLTNVTIPASITNFSTSVFYGCSNLKSAGPIGSGCNIEYGWSEAIPAKAFYNLSALTTVIIAEEITSIGENAFSGCSGLVSAGPAESGSNIEYNWSKEIPAGVFNNFSNLNSVIIAEGITSIGENAFDECDNLESVKIPESLPDISAFSGCSGLVSAGPEGSGSSIEYGWSKEIPAGAFLDFSNLSSVIIAEGITSIGEDAFNGCDNLESVKVPESLTDISAFSGCSGLVSAGPEGSGSSIEYGWSKEIPAGAFLDFSNLSSVIIAEGITSIGENAFNGCDNLESVKVPESLPDISAFSGCSGLVSAGPEGSGSNIEYSWSKEIPAGAFLDFSNLSSVIIAEGITSIEENAFDNCSGLENVTIPKSVIDIGSSIFSGCNKLISAGPEGSGSSIEYGWNTKIPGNAFDDCSNLETIIIPNSVTSIGKSAFYGCSSLKALTIPENVTNIGANAFNSCNSLEHIIIPKEVSNIGEKAFYNCSKLETAGPIGSGCDIEYEWTQTIPAGFGVCHTSFILAPDITLVNAETLESEQLVIYNRDFEDFGFIDSTITKVIAGFLGSKAESYAKNNGYTFEPLQNIEFVEGQTETCEETGRLDTWYCNDCQKNYSEIYHINEVTEASLIIPALGHAYEIEVTEPTCEEAGYSTHVCETCEDSYVDSEVEALGHQLGDWEVTKEADCTEVGEKVKACTRCDYSEAEEISALGHAYETEVTEPTCEEAGYSTHVCETCGDSYVDSETGALGHAYETEVTEPTCEEAGYSTHVCETCGDSYVDSEVEALGHSFTNYVSDGNATSDTIGTKTAKCDRCEATVTVPDPASGVPIIPGKGDVTRLSGSTRYETGYKVADVLKAKLGVEKFDAIIVATGKNFADALSGSYLAVVKKAPIILTNGKDDNIEVLHNYIRENVVEDGTIYILGGEAAVPAEVEKIDGYQVVRLAGKSRYDTNLQILEEAGITGTDLIVATGKNFADSLSASAVAKPILLVKPGEQLNDEQKEVAELVTGGNIYIIGGTGAVSGKIEASLGEYGSVTRVAGKSRYETSVEVAETFFDNVEEVVVASGKNFPDGLCGGPLAAMMDAPLILTADGKAEAAADYLQKEDVSAGYVLGGTSVLTDETVIEVFHLSE